MTTPASDIIDLEEAARRLSVPKSTLKRMIEDRQFPEPVLYESGTRGWPEHVVDAWIASRPRVTDLNKLRKLLKD